METSSNERATDPRRLAEQRHHSLRGRALRASDRLFDLVGLRPLGLIVFALSAVALMHLLGLSVSSVRADGVAAARVVDHPARVASFATRVFVHPGDRVEVGTALVELSPLFIDQELQQLAREIEQAINESRLAQARLVVSEERWLAPGLRQMPKRPSLEQPTAAYYEKQLEVLQSRRAALLEDRKSLTIRSNFRGIVAEVTWVGASVAAGASVASVMPEFAEEIIAYIPPATQPEMITDAAAVYIVGAEFAACRLPGRVQRRGAAVVEAPGQLRQLFRDPLHGLPVHVSIPSECKLGIGQVLRLDFRLEAKG